MNNPALETGIIAWMARNPVAANLLMLVVIAAGIQALFTITKEVFPTFATDSVTITVPYPGSSPVEVEQGILIKIEENIQDIVGIKEIVSTANEGSGVVQVEFEPGTDMSAAINKVKVRVDGISSFPGNAEPPIIEEVLSRSRVVNLTLYGDLEEAQLKQLADVMRDDLLGLPDITQVDVIGSRDYEIAVEVSNTALRQYGLQFDDVVQAIRNQSKDLPGGKLRTDSGTISLRSMGQAYTDEEFSNLILINRPDGTRVRVGDVATVIDGFEDQPLLRRLNGRSGITLKVLRVGKQSSIATSEKVYRYAEKMRQQLPPGVELSVWADRTKILESRMNLLLKSAAQGVLLVMIALTLFLQTTVAFWVVMGLPFCVLGALTVMSLPAVDMSINILSLFGFILVLGILVDDAIVTGESAYHQLEKEGKGVESIIRGVKQVAVPTIFGVLTTILAFIPLLLMKEGIGHMFTYSGPVIIFCLLFSLVETKLILPAHLRHLVIKNNSEAERSEDKNGFMARLSSVQARISLALKNFAQYRYLPVLVRAVKYRYISLALFIAVFIIVVSFLQSGILRFVFFPSVPSNSINVTLQMPQGTAYQQTHDYALLIERAAMEMNEQYRERWGVDVVTALEVESRTDNEARISAELIASTERDITSRALANRWRDKIGILPGVKAMSVDASAGYSGVPVNIELQSNDLEQLRLAAEDIKLELLPFDGVFDVRDTFDAGGPEVDIRITKEGQALGLGQAELARQVRQAFFGAEIQRIQRGRHEVRVYVRFPKEQRHSLETLRSMWVQLPDGSKVPFDVVGDIVESSGISTITRVNRHRVVHVRADVDKTKTSSGAVVQALEDDVIGRVLARYPAVKYRLSGEAEQQDENTQSLLAGTLVMLILIYAALAIPLKSYGQPLIIMAVIPFGIVGAFIGHLIIGLPISVISIVGIIALSGVVVNDSLVLVDYINHRCRDGVNWCDAVMEAGVRRFRAVILTSITTFLGLLPIQLETSIQAQFLKPMAISVAFGVLFATVVTLVLVPILCFIVEDLRNFRRGPALLKGGVVEE